MRTPRDGVLPASDRLQIVALDVTNPESIANAVHTAGPIDVLVNNAGIGAVGAFEATPWRPRESCSTPTPSASWR